MSDEVHALIDVLRAAARQNAARREVARERALQVCDRSSWPFSWTPPVRGMQAQDYADAWMAAHR